LRKKRPRDKLKRKEKKLQRQLDYWKKKDLELKKKQESVNLKPLPRENVRRLRLLQQLLRSSDWNKKQQSKRDKD
jgi:hypothetical protein